mmetsp:Transcript_31612/g.76388  ORF Transcript_31612/g.76388 Transcript_31612/m.76388 type:complete len:166 (+) Transcript_31612:3074-3571(+)
MVSFLTFGKEKQHHCTLAATMVKRKQRCRSECNNDNNNNKNELDVKLSSESSKVREIAGNIVKLVEEQDELSEKEFQQKVDEVTEQWAPKFSTIALFISWAKHSSRHFNSNTIALLNTVAKQCGVTPLELLEKVKSYRIERASGGESYQMKFATTLPLLMHARFP